MVNIAVLLFVVYVFPSIQVNEPQATCVSVPETELLMVKSSVTMESHPLILPLGMVNIAVLLFVVYVFPLIQVNEPQATCVSVPVTELLIVKLSVTNESHPFAAPPTILKVAELLLAV